MDDGCSILDAGRDPAERQCQEAQHRIGQHAAVDAQGPFYAALAQSTGREIGYPLSGLPNSYPEPGSLDDLLGFHLRKCDEQHKSTADDPSFVGHKDLLSDDNNNITIRSHKGTVRVVRNRVRAGIITFLPGKPLKVSRFWPDPGY
jgi:hypothetical protein